jgi:butyrate kinase
MSPERSGTIPAGQLINLCFSGKYSQDEIKKMLVGDGGFVAYLGTNDGYKVEQDARNGDEKSIQIQQALAYQVAKAIGEMAVVLKGDVNAILLTGGMANNSQITDYIKTLVKFIAPVIVYPGEDEMKALAENAFKLLLGEVKARVYKSK